MKEDMPTPSDTTNANKPMNSWVVAVCLLVISAGLYSVWRFISLTHGTQPVSSDGVYSTAFDAVRDILAVAVGALLGGPVGAAIGALFAAGFHLTKFVLF